MSEIVEFRFNNHTITCVIVGGSPWFEAREVATILGYANTKQAIIRNVDDDDKHTYDTILETLQDTGFSESPVKTNEKKSNIYQRTKSV
ncbi:MAG: Bro-N domain-containing protein [Candidatus Fonsibacter sp.]